MVQYTVDTFTDRLFQGNPTAVYVVDRWPEDDLMIQITRESGQLHGAFLLREGEGYHLRWFTHTGEENLLGHPTLAAGFVVTHLLQPGRQEIVFQTRVGPIPVTRQGDRLEMDFPAYELTPLEVTDQIADALGARPVEVWRARDLVCIFEDEETIRNMAPDMTKLRTLKGALMQVTAPGREYDCVSRTFGPKVGMDEDPVCGSGHCHIAPYWSERLGKKELVARQASPRGGTLYCRVEGDRVFLAGQAVLYAKSELMLGEMV